MRYRARLGEFRVWISKKNQFLDLFFCSGRMELTPEWFAERYGSPWAHALMLLKGLWLFMGAMAVVSFVLGAETSLSSARTHYSILSYESEKLEDYSEIENDLLLSFEELKVRDKDWIYPQLDRSFNRSRCNYEWGRLDFPSSDTASIVVSLVDPVFEETSDEGESIFTLGPRSNGPTSNQVYYPLDRYGGAVQLFEVVRPILRLIESVDGFERYLLKSETVFFLERGLSEYLAPGYLYAEVHRFPSEGPEKNWTIAGADFEIVSGRKVDASWAMVTNSEVENHLLNVFSRTVGGYLNNIDSMRSEHERLMSLRPPNSTVTKLVAVVSTIAIPLLLVPVLSLIVVLIGQRDDERPFLEICLITSHILMSSSFAFIVMFGFSDTFANVFPTHDSLLFLLSLAVVFGMLRFHLVQLPLQLTACCGYPVNWNAKSWAFGLRRTCSVPSLLFRILSLVIFALSLTLQIYADELGLLIQLELLG